MGCGIENLDGLENFENLAEINLSNNKISDFSVLDKFNNLQILNLSNNFLELKFFELINDNLR